MKWFKVKPVINRKNGQINVSIPKKKMSKEKLAKLIKHKELKMRLKV